MASNRRRDVSITSFRTYEYTPQKADDLRDYLANLLDAIKSAGSYATFGQLDSNFLVDPEITVNGIGRMELPLVHENAQRLINACRQAPFGRGEDTIVDLSVRNTLQLDNDKFQITSPQWPEFMASLVERVKTELGCNETSTIEAHLYKMLLYEKGAMFKPHRDSEKEPGMIGTLIICLPSSHRGGEVIAEHACQKKIFRTSSTNQSYVAWYSDVSHEVKEVTAGYRWVLTYNLVDRAQVPTARMHYSTAQHISEKELLRNRLLWWSKACEQDKTWNRHYVYFLEHQYTDAGLRLEGLKGVDSDRVTALKEACEGLDFSLFLSSYARRATGQCDEPEDYEDWYPWDLPRGRTRTYHPIVWEEAWATILTRVVDFSGMPIIGNVSTGDNNFMQRDYFKDVEPDEEEAYTGPVGNDSCTAVHWYRGVVRDVDLQTYLILLIASLQAVIILPRASLPRFLLNPYIESLADDDGYRHDDHYRFNGLSIKSTFCPKLAEVIDIWTQNVNLDPHSHFKDDVLRTLCRAAINHQSIEAHDSLLCAVIKASERLGSSELLAMALAELEGGLSDDMIRAISGLLWNKGFQPLRDILNAYLEEDYIIHEHYTFIRALLRPMDPGFEDRKVKAEQWGFFTWAQKKIEDVLMKAPKVYVEDGWAMVQILKETENFQDLEMFSKVYAALDNVRYKTPVMISFLNGFFEAAQCGTIPKETGLTTFESIASQVVANFSLAHDPKQVILLEECKAILDSEVVDSETDDADSDSDCSSHIYERIGRQRLPPKQEPRVAAVSGPGLSAFLGNLMSLDLVDLVDDVADKIQSEASTIDEQDFAALLVPFLRSLAGVLAAHGIAPTEAKWQALYSAVLARFAHRVADGAGPPAPGCWARPTLLCRCRRICAPINAFLLDPAQQTARFRLGPARRRHAHAQLEKAAADVDCEHGHTDNSTNPATLVVVKRPSKEDSPAEHARRRKEVYAAQVQLLAQDVDLRKVLGEEYAGLVSERGIEHFERLQKRGDSNMGGRKRGLEELEE